MTDINDRGGTEPSAENTPDPRTSGAGPQADTGPDAEAEAARAAGETSSPQTGGTAPEQTGGTSEPGSPRTGVPADGHTEPELGPRLFHLTMLLRRAERHGPHGPHRGPGGPGPRHHQMGQGRVLTLLTMRSPIAQRELAYLLGIRPQSLGEILGKLESAGLVARTVDPADARARLVAITDAGTEAAEALARAPRLDPLAPLDETERTQFLAFIDRVSAGLEEALGIDEAERGPFPFDGPDGLFPSRGGRGFRRGGKDRGRGTGSRPWEGDDADGYGPRGDEAPGWGPRGRGQAGPRHHGHRGGPRGPLDGWPEPESGDEARRFRGRRRGCGRPGSEDCGPRW